MKRIEQTITLPAAPAEVFEALMDASRHAAFTNAPATIVREVGGAMSCYGGMVTGILLDVAPGERIVQAWRPANFPPGVFTLATFALAADGEGTTLTFTQDAVPDAAYDHLAKGWHERYWEPLRTYLARKK